MEPSVSKIKEKLERGDGVVVSAQELKQMVRDGERLDEVDVITCATRAVMSGTMLVLSFRAAERNEFVKAREMWVGGIPAHVGPCPNERLGYIDCTLHATDHRDARYGGGHLIRELLEKRRVDVRILTHEGRTVHTAITLDEVEHARMLGTRCAFMNYLAIVNPSSRAVPSIFSIEPMKPHMSEATVAGCGELNPVQNDPTLQAIGVGTRVLYNGAEGFVLGLGTRTYPTKPNLSLVADLKHMSPRWTGGFITSLSPEVISTVAVPIPITSKRALEHAKVLDEDTPLMVASVLGRGIIARTSYADVWQGT
ncbi:MAG: methanogenesis marker 16 metalloprotein, partial [Methermicoccaceae archaeon]